MEKEVSTYYQSIEYAAEYLAKVCKEVSRKVHKEKGFDVSHEEYILMETIFLNPGIMQGQIADKISMQRNYVCKLLTKLKSAGYIKRKTEIKGKRQVTYNNYLTIEGEKIYKD